MDQENEKRTDAERYAKPEIEDDVIAWDTDEAPTEWVPTQFEKRIKAIPDKQWDLYQYLGGALIGVIAVVCLFSGGAGLSAGFLIAVVLAMLVPNWLENKGRRKLTKGRYVMLAVMTVGSIAMVLYTGFTKGWAVFTRKETQALAAFLMKA